MDKDKAFFFSLSLSTTQHNTLGGNEKESDSIKTASSDKEKKNMEAGFQTTSALKESERERENGDTQKMPSCVDRRRLSFPSTLRSACCSDIRPPCHVLV